LIAGYAAVAMGCAGGARTPRQAAESIVAALEANDWATLHDMLTDRAKATEYEMMQVLPGGHDALRGRTPRQAFIALHESGQPPNIRAVLVSLQVDVDRAIALVEQFPRRTEWRLVCVGGRWQITGFGVTGVMEEDRPDR